MEPLEIESTSRQRRQSAPPPISISLDQHRDEAYMRAISKFNEWRNNQRFERLNETKNTSAFTDVPTVERTLVTDDFSMISDVVIGDDEKRRLIEMHRERKKIDAARRHEHKASVQKNTLNQRYSLPLMKGNPSEKVSRRKNRKSQVHPSSTIDEIEEFELNHCVQLDEDVVTTVLSPPSKVTIERDPFCDQSEHSPKQPPQPKKQSLMGRNMLRRGKNTGKGKAPQPPVVESEVSSNFYNGNYKHYDVVNSGSVYDDFLMATKAYNLRKQQPEKVNSVGESASSGSLSSESEKNNKKIRRLSPPYQTVINKHGDEVEYALPYSERESLSNIPPLPSSAPPIEEKLPASKFEQIINENFQFLTNLEFYNADDEAIIPRDHISSPFEPIETSFSDIRRHRNNLQVTDLDKSNDTAMGGPRSGDFLKEIDALSTWTKNLQNCDENLDSKSPLGEYQKVQTNIKVFSSRDIKYKSGILRNSFSTPLEFSNGYFNRTPITLRSTLPNIYSINCFADIASKHEFEILSQIKHQSVAILMGISYDDDLRVISLVMEPFDYTLNHYLHQMDQYFSIQETISIVIQIANATQYLHECGFVHSNISSHTVLIRENPFAVKLSSFELTTEILPRSAIGKIFHPKHVEDEEKNLMMTAPAGSILAERYYKLSKQHFYNRTSMSTITSAPVHDESDYRMPYSAVYRRMFAMHYYQAPELLIPVIQGTTKCVFPSTRADTFALGLLLWEALNHCVPFVIYNHEELILAYKQNDAKLPLLDKSATAFMEIFDSCLRVNAEERLSDASELISMLDEIQRAGEGKKKETLIDDKLENMYSRMNTETKKNFKDAKPKEKLPEKVYFSRKKVADPQKRNENAITVENLQLLNQKDTSKVSESLKSSEMEAHLTSFSQQPAILQDSALDRIRQTVEDQRVIAPKKPSRRMDEEPETLEASRRSLTDSTMYQSFFNYNFHTPKIDKGVIYERNSTLKGLKLPDGRKQKKSVKELFDEPPVKDGFGKMNDQLNQIAQDYDKMDFMNEIVKELNDRQKKSVDDDGVSSLLNRGMATTILDQSQSYDELPKKIDKQNIKRSGSDSVGEYSRFSMTENSLSRTPIARQNKIRRNAWLSDSKKPSGGRISDFGLKPNKSGSDLNEVNNSSDASNRKQYNVNIKIHHNELDGSHNGKNSNISQSDSSINIRFFPPANESFSPLVKINNTDLNKSSYNADINKKYYPGMPEMLSDVIQNKRDRSGFLQVSHCEGGRFETSVCVREKEVEENVIVPVRTSVREAIKFIESTFKPGTTELKSPGRVSDLKSPGCVHAPIAAAENCSQPQVKSNQAHEETQTEISFTPAVELPKAENDSSNEPQSAANMPLVNKRLENVLNPTPKKITTKVTVNLKKLTGRASDVEHLKKNQDQSRHSICNNAELIKRIQMHFKVNPPLQSANKNDAISASCGSLVRKEVSNGIVQQTGKCQKYFCRNCGFTMLPAEMLQKIQSSSRLSIATSHAEGLQSIKYEEGSQSMSTALRKCKPVTGTKSIEDLYIDDDFCQGIHQSLAANMELLPTPDFFESFDFNFLTAEIFHTQEQQFDCTLTDGEQMQLDWRQGDLNDEVFEVEQDEGETSPIIEEVDGPKELA